MDKFIRRLARFIMDHPDLFALGMFLLLSAFAVFAIYNIERNRCMTGASEMGRQYKFDMEGGCRIKSNGGLFIPARFISIDLSHNE